METWLGSVAGDDRVATCTIVRGEILFGIGRLAEGRRRSAFEEKAQGLFEIVPCEPIPARAADLYATIKLARRRRGLALDENDLWIAATASALDATLVSRDHDFDAIDGLRILVLP